MKAIDLFAGAGGFSEGARMAGVEVCWAANHWAEAVHYHRQNHPDTLHACQDLQQADWRDVPHHDVLLASPACQGHSLARGKERPHHDALRSTAWAVVSCAECHRTPRLGYAVAPHLIDAADHGVPQHRKRLFLICTQSKHPLELKLPKRKHQPVSNLIEWDGDGWNDIERPGRSEKTLARIAAGRAQFGERFVAPYYSAGSGLTGRSIDRPIGTITTRDRWAVIKGKKMRMLKVSEAKAAMGFRRDYVLPSTHRDGLFMLGNAVCPPVSADILHAIRCSA